MNTPSHWLMTVAAGRIGPWREKVPRWSLGLGSLAADIPLYLLSFGGIFYYSYWRQWPGEQTFPHMYADSGLFFNDPVWITLHNLLHSPTMICLLFASTWLTKKNWPSSTSWFRFFLSACALHSVVDILTHHDDGPLLFFPFDWHTRFSSPVSYWDRDHYGGIFMVFEAGLDLVLTVFLVVSFLFGPKSFKNGRDAT